MSEQPLVIYDFRNPEEAFELMRGGKQGIVTEDFVIKLTALIERLQEQLNEARHTIYCIANTDGSDCKTILETIIRDANLYLEKWGVK